MDKIYASLYVHYFKGWAVLRGRTFNLSKFVLQYRYRYIVFMKVFSSPTNVDMHPLYPTGHLSTNSDFLEGWYWLHFPSFLPGKSLCKLCSSAFLLGPSSVHTKQLWLVTRNRSKEYADKDK